MRDRHEQPRAENRLKISPLHGCAPILGVVLRALVLLALVVGVSGCQSEFWRFVSPES